MWKHLTSTQRVNRGDKLRFHLPYDVKKTETLFKVVKTDEHYFEILPVVEEIDSLQSHSSKKIVRYFDLGYNIQIEVWDEPRL
jgi:hypothetical protein